MSAYRVNVRSANGAIHFQPGPTAQESNIIPKVGLKARFIDWAVSSPYLRSR
jgi:hypothetical protein